MKIAILGAGGFGTALAKYLTSQEQTVTLWSAIPEELEDIILHKENTKLLPGVSLNMKRIICTTRLEDIKESEILFFAVASPWVRSVAKKAAPFIRSDAYVVNVAKGFEQDSFQRLSVVIQEELPKISVVALSGPSHAEEIARGVETAIVASSQDEKAAKSIQNFLTSSSLRIYTNKDIIGVEYGGALKNIIALCTGICDGLQLGDNTKAALMTRGITEIARLGIAAGAEENTFWGLSGIGDLIVTCTSMHSRNRRAGILIGKGEPPSEAIRKIGMTVEGYAATNAAYHLAQKYHASMPITEELYQVLYRKTPAKSAILKLMQRPVTSEQSLLSSSR